MCRQFVDPETVLRLLKGEPLEPDAHRGVYVSDFDEDWIWYRPLHQRRATREDVIGFLCRGGAGEYLLEPGGRMPALAKSLQLLQGHYRVNRSVLGEACEPLECAVPKTLSGPERARLLGILQNGWTQLKEMLHESVGEEPVRLATAAA